MQKIKDFKISDIPIEHIVFITTSEMNYSMDRTMLVRNWPNRGVYTVVHGEHCSCCGFDDAHWEAIAYTPEELGRVARNWVRSGERSEQMIAPMVVALVSDDELYGDFLT